MVDCPVFPNGHRWLFSFPSPSQFNCIHPCFPLLYSLQTLGLADRICHTPALACRIASRPWYTESAHQRGAGVFSWSKTKRNKTVLGNTYNAKQNYNWPVVLFYVSVSTILFLDGANFWHFSLDKRTSDLFYMLWGKSQLSYHCFVI